MDAKQGEGGGLGEDQFPGELGEGVLGEGGMALGKELDWTRRRGLRREAKSCEGVRDTRGPEPSP